MTKSATDSDVFSVISASFAAVDEEYWNRLVGMTRWAEFLRGVRRMVSQGETGCMLQDCLSPKEASALHEPPTYRDKCRFAARHFTGGLPTSAQPVESLYRTRSSASQNPPGAAVAHEKSLYLGDSALYMTDLVDRLGLSVPDEFRDAPDHLALETDLIAVLLDAGNDDDAHAFAVERLSWLSDYRHKLLDQEDAFFYLALVDVLLAVVDRWSEGRPSHTAPNSMDSSSASIPREETLCQKTQ